MTDEAPSTESSENNDFAEQAKAPQQGIVREFIDFLAHNKKWWLTPIILTLLLLGLIILLGGTGAAPFIYTIF